MVMSKPKAICVRELFVDGANDVEGDVNIDDAIFYKHDVSKTANPLITAPVYLHEWWVKESDNTTELLQMAEQARERGHHDLADEYETKVKIIREVMNNVHRWTEGATGYQIAPNTITAGSEGEDE